MQLPRHACLRVWEEATRDSCLAHSCIYSSTSKFTSSRISLSVSQQRLEFHLHLQYQNRTAKDTFTMFSRAISLQLLLWNTYVAAQSLLTLTASLPGNPLHGLAVNADGESFALGGSPSYYCPSSVEPNCPNTTETVFTPGLGALDVSHTCESRDFGHNADDSLQVEVPGGQQVYISSDGELGFTQAHSAYVPPGAYYGGWINVTIVSDCSPTYTVLTWTSATTSKILHLTNISTSCISSLMQPRGGFCLS